ncbi:MAG: division/cell wall cluster transcriptional repressor MraZ [Saprospiraceae bacterium]|nr:division/cell wall cluster transcriptional repressor MraZ [Saprospiraceae bacterium]
MYNLIGEFEVRLDEKKRLKLPTSLVKQIGEDVVLGLVINRGTEKCLNLYPKKLWDYKSAIVNQLNLYNSDNKEFARYFYRGATLLEVDSTIRFVIPKLLLDHAGITQNLILNCYGSVIELWSELEYQQLIKNEPKNIIELAEKVFGYGQAK